MRARRSFIKQSVLAASGAGVGLGLLGGGRLARAQDDASGGPSRGDIAILRFLAAVELIESDLWLQYAELGGVQDNELPGLPTGGSAPYIAALSNLDADMPQYIHDNTEDEISHETFLNAYLEFEGCRSGQPRSVPYLAE